MNLQIGLGSKGRGWTIAAAALLGAALLAPPAGAQTKEELDEARSAFQQGVALMAANNCAAALTKFQAVIQVKRTPQVLFNIGECEERLGKLVSALGNYRLAAAAAEGDKKAKDVAAQVGARIAGLEERIPKLTIRRGSGAETATILLDGTEVRETSDDIPVDPGSHVVVGRVGDRDGFTETVAIEEKGKKTVEVVIEVADKPVETTPIETPTEPDKPVDKPSKVPGGVVLGLGIASGIAGGVFMGLAAGAKSDLDEMCGNDKSCPPSAEETADKGKLFEGVGWATIGLGAVGIVTGIVLLATSGGEKKKPEGETLPEGEPVSRAKKPRWLRPEIALRAPGADVGGLSVVGRF